MSHSDSLKNVPNVNSKEFEKFLEDNGFNKNVFNEDFINNLEAIDELSNSLKDNPTPDQPKNESIGKILFKIVDNWCMKNPGPSLAIILGGSAFICYKLTVGILSQAIFKGNLKTSRYFDKHAGQQSIVLKVGGCLA